MRRMRSCALNAASRSVGKPSDKKLLGSTGRPSSWVFEFLACNDLMALKNYFPCHVHHSRACRLQFAESSSSPQLTGIVALFNSWAFCKSRLSLKAFHAWLSLDISHQAGFGWDVDLQEKLIMVNGKHDHTHFFETCTATISCLST